MAHPSCRCAQELVRFDVNGGHARGLGQRWFAPIEQGARYLTIDAVPPEYP